MYSKGRTCEDVWCAHIHTCPVTFTLVLLGTFTLVLLGTFTFVLLGTFTLVLLGTFTLVLLGTFTFVLMKRHLSKECIVERESTCG